MINEADVRTWMKRIGGKHLFWVEPARGSTFGLPDAYCAINGLGHLWFELKYGTLHLNDCLTFELRPEQRATMRRLLDAGGRVALAVGYFGAVSPIILRANERVLSGKVHLPQAIEADLAVVAGTKIDEKSLEKIMSWEAKNRGKSEMMGAKKKSAQREKVEA